METTTRWISRSEREPEHGKEVLLCTEFDGHQRISVGEYDKFIGGFVRYSRGEGARSLELQGDIITHWMPLPALPTR